MGGDRKDWKKIVKNRRAWEKILQVMEEDGAN